jgi:hypothetical protein
MKIKFIIKALAVTAFAVTLGSCKEETLAKCALQGEQITATRRMTAPANLRETIEYCEKTVLGGRDFCEATYLDANRVVRICMEAEYYAFENADSGFGNCGYEKFKDPTRYGFKPLLELQKFFTEEKK